MASSAWPSKKRYGQHACMGRVPFEPGHCGRCPQNISDKMDGVHKPLPMTRPSAAPPARTTYRHGDLRRALLEAGLALAREGGPDAVALREVTRRVGVVPNAAYRHFANHAELLQAVRAEALAAVARSMEHELDAVPPLGPRTKPGSAASIAHARARLRAGGRG